MSEQESPEALRWLAFRYQSGELTADESQAFEQRLLSDQAACDALEEAVELSLAVHQVAESLPPLSASPPLRQMALRPWPWLLALAGSIAVLYALGQGTRRNATPHDAAERLAEEQVSLVWAGLYGQPLDAEQLSPALRDAWQSVEPLEPVSLPTTHGEVQNAAESVVPQWLMTGVSCGTLHVEEEP